MAALGRKIAPRFGAQPRRRRRPQTQNTQPRQAPRSRKVQSASRPMAEPRQSKMLSAPLKKSRNWWTARLRAARYSGRSRVRLIAGMVTGALAFIMLALWIGGFMPNVRQAGSNFVQARLMSAGFVVDGVDVMGVGRMDERNVRQALGVQPGDYLFKLDVTDAQTRIEKLDWVETALVRRLWPSRYVVHITERRPTALWQENNTLKVVDAGGDVIAQATPARFNALPLLVGEGAAQAGRPMMDMVMGYPEIAKRTQALVFIDGYRWDLTIKGQGPRVMLSEDRPAQNLALLARLQAETQILDRQILAIDLRIAGRLIIKRADGAWINTKA